MANGDGAKSTGKGAGIAASIAAVQPWAAAAFGIGQIIVGQVQKKKAERARPPLQDPMQAQMLKEFRQKALLSRTGAASQSAREELLDQEGRIARGVQRSTGGAGGATIAGLARLRGQTGRAFNQVLAADQERGFRYETLSADLVNRMAQRRMDIESYEWGSLLAREASNKKAGMENLLAGIEMMAENKEKSGQGAAPSQPGAADAQKSNALSNLFSRPAETEAPLVPELDDIVTQPVLPLEGMKNHTRGDFNVPQLLK